ncbi:aminotransferase class I/II-fold pyridoxal phosphate-dependent enzyme [soil metagenome]
MIDHDRAPILEGIQWFVERDFAPFATPGHKRGRGVEPGILKLFGERLFEVDIPLGGGIDDTHFSQQTLVAAEKLGADAWGAERTFYLLNGSSAGNHAFLLGMCAPGDTVIVARDIHKSLLVALILTGVKPVWVAPRLHPELEFGLGVHPDDIAAALDEHPEAKLVVLVSPSYNGVSSDLEAIANEAHGRGVPVYVDEAWGPHFHFHPDLPKSAMASGIDGAVTSAHKILPSVNQAALLNIQGPFVDKARMKTAVAMVNTTSPSVIILGSIDAARRQMALHGQDLLSVAIELSDQLRSRLAAIPGVSVLTKEALGVASYDLTKLVIDVHELGLTGYEVEEMMRQRFHLQPEMSDLMSIVCLISVADDQHSIDRLVDAFATMSSERHTRQHTTMRIRSAGLMIAPGIQALSPREAFFAKTRQIPLECAEGEISAELVIPYPPGIPVLAPGEIIQRSKLDYLREGAAHGMYLSGASDPEARTIRVVDIAASAD